MAAVMQKSTSSYVLCRNALQGELDISNKLEQGTPVGERLSFC